MSALFLFTAVLAFSAAAALPMFETAAGVMLFGPAVIYVLERACAEAGSRGPAERTASLICWGAVLGYALVCTVLWFRNLKKESSGRWRQVPSAIVLLGTYLALYSLCARWPDFFPTGERMRDYGILSAVIHGSLRPEEPYFAGYTMNYYVYWYRWGHILQAMFGLDTGVVYDQLAALTFAFFSAAVFHLFYAVFRFGPVVSFLSMGVACFGSNAAGVYSALTGDQNWWGPSRVIKGVINEFPVWSFLLGDLHPHFLGLMAVPLLLVLYSAFGEIEVPLWRLTLRFVLVVLGTLIVANGNAWEVPVWGAIVGALVFLEAVEVLRQDRVLAGIWRRPWSALRDASRFQWAKTGVIVATALVLAFGLVDAARIIHPADYPLTAVREPIAETLPSEALLHWGIPLALLAWAGMRELQDWTSRGLVVVLLAVSLALRHCWPLYAVVGSLAGVVMLRDLRTGSLRSRIVAAGLIGAGCAVLFPEFYFLDDPYGGENERMNTMMKLYSASWVWIEAAAMYYFLQAESRRPFRAVLMAAALAVVCGLFFVHTIPLRVSRGVRIEPAIAGLSAVEAQFPGSAGAIIAQRSLPRGVMLEAQGTPYSWTSYFATLTGNVSYLGWQNHVDLLIRDYEESRRRATLTERFYKFNSCEERKAVMAKEKIRYALVGPLELKAYGDGGSEGYQCLKLAVRSGGLAVYELESAPHS